MFKCTNHLNPKLLREVISTMVNETDGGKFLSSYEVYNNLVEHQVLPCQWFTFYLYGFPEIFSDP